jgi:hypothetical protein
MQSHDPFAFTIHVPVAMVDITPILALSNVYSKFLA